mmetsp:Transcript_17435/g.22802  ORF Transcript_17435/g.22802 Transcript_17435/m.22802 type:complete len:89 (+) Transcript_17435:214-480(+)
MCERPIGNIFLIIAFLDFDFRLLDVLERVEFPLDIAEGAVMSVLVETPLFRLFSVGDEFEWGSSLIMTGLLHTSDSAAATPSTETTTA